GQLRFHVDADIPSLVPPLLNEVVLDAPSLVDLLGCAMKSHLLAVAVCLTVCAGCQSSNLLSSRLGHGREDELAELAESSNSTKTRPGLPPPTNARTRESDKSLSAVDDHVLRGEAALRDGRNHEAQQHFEQALLIEPEHAKANHRMAVVSDKLGQYDRAERH